MRTTHSTLQCTSIHKDSTSVRANYQDPQTFCVRHSTDHFYFVRKGLLKNDKLRTALWNEYHHAGVAGVHVACNVYATS